MPGQAFSFITQEATKELRFVFQKHPQKAGLRVGESRAEHSWEAAETF